MIQENKLFIGIWDQRDENGNETETGGIIREKDSGNFLFNVKVLNEQYNKEYDDVEIHVYPNELKKMGLDNFLSVELLADELSKWVFIFNIISHENNVFAVNVKREPKNNDFRDNDKFELVPVFHKTDAITDVKSFNYSLLSNEELKLNDAELLDEEEGFAIFQSDIEHNIPNDDRFYENLDVQNVQSQYVTYAVPTDNDAVTERKWEKGNWADAIYEVKNSNFLFIPNRYLMAEHLESIAPKIKDLVKGNPSDEREIDPRLKPNQILERNFIDRFFRTIRSTDYDLTFYEHDLLNFHNSIKSNSLTILAGLSGTGKSKIAIAYADALVILSESDQFNLISVRPFWQDDADLLGYVDTLSNNYHPGDSGLVNTLISANRNQDKLYVVLLDEMNLAKVEHYFSQFLSVLEMKKNDNQGERRYIKLYDKSLEPRLYNSDKYPSQIPIGSNIRFIGTMNTDESTFQLSDKLLDRANLISLRMVPFAKIKTDLSPNPNDVPEVTASQYNSMKNDSLKLNETELNFFWEFDQLIENHLPNVGLGWRILKDIQSFLSNVLNYKGFDRRIALDYQVAQRVLPKIRGTEVMLEKLLNTEGPSNDGGEIEALLDKYSNLSKFEQSKRVLLKKALELKVNGFVR